MSLHSEFEDEELLFPVVESSGNKLEWHRDSVINEWRSIMNKSTTAVQEFSIGNTSITVIYDHIFLNYLLYYFFVDSGDDDTLPQTIQEILNASFAK